MMITTTLHFTEEYLGPYQTSMIKRFGKTLND